MTKSTKLAIAVFILLALWVGSGALLSGGKADGPVASTDERLFTVRVSEVRAQDFTRVLTIRGRTEAIRAVELKAEVTGQVVATPVEKGARVESGALICRLSPDDRTARLAEARALAEQRRLEYDVAQKLAEKEFRSATQLAQARAQYETALAQVSQMELALENTYIRAPFAALVEDRPAEVGDYLQQGGVCARLLQEDPFLVVGEVSENDVVALKAGAEATVHFAGGFERAGRIRYISSTAEERTRTFRVEVAVPNPDHRFREGMTADVRVPLESVRAHFLSPTVLVLDAAGRLGVRTVSDSREVEFHPVRILSDEAEGIWVAGLPPAVRVITVGQEFVAEGQEVAVASASGEIG